jgi:hypothetical protein
MTQTTVDFTRGAVPEARGRNGWFRPMTAEVIRYEDAAHFDMVRVAVRSKSVPSFPPIYMALSLEDMRALHAAIGAVLVGGEEEVSDDFFSVLGAAFPGSCAADLARVRCAALAIYAARMGTSKSGEELAATEFFDACGEAGGIGNSDGDRLYIRPVGEDGVPTGPRVYIPEVQA